MKWLYFIIIVLINSTAAIGITLAAIGITLETIGFTFLQALFISIFIVLIIITIVGFIVIESANQHEKREKEFQVLVEKLRGQEEAIKTVKEQVFRIGQNVLISEEKLEDIKEEFKRLKWCELEGLVAKVLSPLLSLLFSLSESPILSK